MENVKALKLEAEGLGKVYGSRQVVQGVTLSVRPGEVVGLLGPNGAGKTTVFYMIVGLVFPTQGKIRLNDRDLTSLPLHERARLGIAYLPQETSLFKKLSVYDNVAMALEARGYDGALLDRRCQELLDRFGLSALNQNPASTLSGGERRRCEIARCLAIEPHFVLLDEPFAGVDPIAVGEIRQFIGDLKKSGIGVLITDHNVRETLSSCDRGYLMRAGEVFFSGSPDEIASNEEARTFYLGKDFSLS